MEKLFTIKEAAEAVKACEETIRKKVRLGEIESVQIGRISVIPEEALLRFINKNRIYCGTESKDGQDL